jgi:hypothetical protein
MHPYLIGINDPKNGTVLVPATHGQVSPCLLDSINAACTDILVVVWNSYSTISEERGTLGQLGQVSAFNHSERWRQSPSPVPIPTMEGYVDG